MTAPEVAPRDLINVLDGYIEVARRLVIDFGITITFTDISDDIGIYDGDIRTVFVDQHSPIEDQCCFLIDVWKFCAIGHCATPDAVAVRNHLRAVD